jgi:hypothetical protein
MIKTSPNPGNSLAKSTSLSTKDFIFPPAVYGDFDYFVSASLSGYGRAAHAARIELAF